MNARRRFACRAVVYLLGLSSCLALGLAPIAAAELAQEHREKLVWIDQQLQKAVTLYKDKKTDDLNKLIVDVESAIEGLKIAAEGQENLDAILNPFRARVSAARKLASYVPPQAVVAKPVQKPKGGVPTAGGVSFSKEIAPILIAKCGNCHVMGNRGDLSMANYDILMKGTAGQYTIIKPGKGDTSTIVEKMASGEMPPGGNKCTDAEINLFIKWINEGAKFDGMDAMASLYDLNPGTPGTPSQPSEPVVARGGAGDKVQFMRDVLPILRDNCFQCHDATGQDAAGRFSMASFRGMLAGGQDSRNKTILPGDPEGSYMIQMIRGTALGPDGKTKKPKMPRRGSLDDAEVTTLVTWIKDGAKFDGESQTESLDLLFRIEVAKKATHEELTASRLAEAKKLWKRGNTDSAYEVIETKDFSILGDLGPVRMQEVAALAEAEKDKVCTTLKLPTDRPLVKGKITLFVFDKKFEYTEFGRVAEGRELPQQQLGHWFFNFIDCYGGVVAQDSTPEVLGPLLTEVIVGAYLDSLGSSAPRWFAVGTARNVAAQLHAKSPVVKGWQDAVMVAAGAQLSSDAVLNTKNPDANVKAAAQIFVRDLMKQSAWTSLLSSIAKGSKFDPAFNNAFRNNPKTVFDAWARTARP